jgi:thiamine-phosphate pyrophosphorylase
MKPLADCKLYAFVDAAYLNGRAPEVVARQLCDGGADLIQLRAKESSPDHIRRMADAILPVTRAANAGLVINDHCGIARELGAELCHLGQEDFFDAGHAHVTEIKDANRSSVQTGTRQSEIQIGLSTHAPAQAERAIAAGADYIAIGPVYPTGTKPGAKPVTLEYVRWAAAHVKIPWFAIGGITLDTVDAVIEAGATRICVVSAILDTADPAAACRKFRARLD